MQIKVPVHIGICNLPLVEIHLSSLREVCVNYKLECYVGRELYFSYFKTCQTLLMFLPILTLHCYSLGNDTGCWLRWINQNPFISAVEIVSTPALCSELEIITSRERISSLKMAGLDLESSFEF